MNAPDYYPERGAENVNNRIDNDISKPVVDQGIGNDGSCENYRNVVKPPKSALTLGARGNINGVEYLVAGRTRYRDNRTYRWWDEWLLQAGDGQSLQLVENDFKFTLMYSYTPKESLMPGAVGKQIEIDGHRIEVDCNSTALVLFREGEQARNESVDGTVNFLEAWRDDETLYACKWHDGETDFCFGKCIPTALVYEAFNLGKPPEGIVERKVSWNKKSPFQQWVMDRLQGPAFRYTIIAGLLCFAAATLGGCLGTEVPSSNGYAMYSNGAYIYGPYKLTDQNRVHRVTTVVRAPNNTSLYCEIGLLDNNKELLLGWDHDFWLESSSGGVDGSWVEGDLRKKAWFVLKTPGEYYLEIVPEKPVDDFTKRAVVTVRKGVCYTPPLWTMGLYCLIYPGLILALFVISLPMAAYV